MRSLLSAIVLVRFLTRVNLVGVAKAHSHPVMVTDAGSGGDICIYRYIYRLDCFVLESLGGPRRMAAAPKEYSYPTISYAPLVEQIVGH